VSAEDFYLLVPEDEWIEERLSKRKPYDPDEVIELVHQRAEQDQLVERAEPWWWFNAWKAVRLALWLAVCVLMEVQTAGFPPWAVAFGVVLLIFLRTTASAATSVRLRP
jgi:hypothetical protein